MDEGKVRKNLSTSGPNS